LIVPAALFSALTLKLSALNWKLYSLDGAPEQLIFPSLPQPLAFEIYVRPAVVHDETQGDAPLWARTDAPLKAEHRILKQNAAITIINNTNYHLRCLTRK